MLQDDEPFLSKSSLMSKLRRDESQLHNEKKEYEKYQSFLKKEVDELFSKNEQLLSCFISHKKIFEDLELQNKLLEEQYKNELLEESRSKRIKVRLSQIKDEQNPIFPSRVLIPMENTTQSQHIQLSKEYHELEKKISEININQISKLLEEKQKLAERHIELKKEAAYLMSQLLKPENKPSNKSETLFYHMLDAMNECDKNRQKLFIIKHGSRAQINDLKLFTEESEKENIDVLDLLKLFPDIQPNPNLKELIDEEIENKKRKEAKRKRIEAMKQKDEEFLRNLNHRQRTTYYPIRPPDQKKVTNPKASISDSEEKNKNDQINRLRLSLNSHLAELKNSNQKKITSPTANDSIFPTNKKNARRKINSNQISNDEPSTNNDQLIDQEQLNQPHHKHKNMIRKKRKSHTKSNVNYPPQNAPGIHIHPSDFASSSSTSAARKREENILLYQSQNKNNQNIDQNQVEINSPQDNESDKKSSNIKSPHISSPTEVLKKKQMQIEEEEEQSESSAENEFEFEKTLEIESKIKAKIEKEKEEEEKKEQPKEEPIPIKVHIGHNPKQFVEEESHQDDYSKTEFIQDIEQHEEEEDKEKEKEEKIKIEQIIEETTIKEKRIKRKRKHKHHKNDDLDDSPKDNDDKIQKDNKDDTKKDDEDSIPKDEVQKTSDDSQKSYSSDKLKIQQIIEKNINDLLFNRPVNEDHHQKDEDESYTIKTKSHSKHRSNSVKITDSKLTSKKRSNSVESKDQEIHKSRRRKRKHRSKSNDQNEEDTENLQNNDVKENDKTEKSNSDDNSNQSSDKKSQTIVFKLQKTKENNPHVSSSSSSPPDFNTAELEKIKAIENQQQGIAESEEKRQDDTKKPLKKVPMKKKRKFNIELDKKPVIIDEQKVEIDNVGGRQGSSKSNSKTRHHSHHSHHHRQQSRTKPSKENNNNNNNNDDDAKDDKNDDDDDEYDYPSDQNYEYNYEYDYEFDDKDYYSNDNKRSKKRRHGRHYRRKTNRKFYTRHPHTRHQSSHHHHHRNNNYSARRIKFQKHSSSAEEGNEKKGFRSTRDTPTKKRRRNDYDYDPYSDSYNYSDDDYNDPDYYNSASEDYEYEVQEEKVFKPLSLQISKDVFIHEEKESRPRNPRVFQRKIIPKQTQQQQQQQQPSNKQSLLALSLNEGNELLNSIHQKQIKESKTLSQFEQLNEFVIHEPNEAFETLRRKGRGKQLDSEIAQARDKLSKINKEINDLQKQLKKSLMKTSSTQVDEPFSMKSLSDMKNEIKNNENLDDLLEKARKQKELLEKELPEKQNKLSDLQKLYVRKASTLRHYKQMRDDLTEQNFFILNANKKQIKKLNDLDEQIRRGRKTIEIIDGRIADIKNIIDIKTKELSIKASKKRPNVVEMCSKFKRDRVSEREMLQLIEYHDIERQYLEKAIEAISYQISNDSLTKKELEIERIVIIAKQLKEKYFQKRGMSNQSMITITNEDDLNLLTKKKALTKEEIHSTMMQIDLVISQIQKQINILNNKFVEVPPPPSSFISLQARQKSKLESMTSLS